MVNFAPLDVPVRRRLQTLMVAVMLLGLPWFLFTCVVVLGAFWPVTWPLLLLCAAWVAADRRTPSRRGRMVPWFRRGWAWRHFKEYFPASVVVEQRLEPGRPTVIGLHPHGIVGLGVWANVAALENEADRKLGGVDYRICTVWHNFMVPLWRDFLMAMGFVDAGRDTFDAILGGNGAVCIVVGGAAEALESSPGTNRLVLRRRRGFVRAALRHGADLVPTFSFGETDLYEQRTFAKGSLVRRLQDAFKRVVGLTAPLVYGRGFFQYDFGMLPRRHPLVTVFGPPVRVPRVAEPSDDEVDKHLGRYIDALLELHGRYRERFGAPAIEIVA